MSPGTLGDFAQIVRSESASNLSLNMFVTRPLVCIWQNMPVHSTPLEISSLLTELRHVRESCIAMEKEFGTSIAEACPQSRRSVQNFLHYLALRQHDLRKLQPRLTALGLSSLGRDESSTLAGLEAVIAVLESLAGDVDATPLAVCVDFETGPATLSKQAAELLGPVPEGRAVRVMVTMPSEAAHSYELVKSLLDAGMDVMRVNCAHDSEQEWECMIAHLRRATGESGKHCKVLMDLAGPKLRTGPLPHGHHVARWRVDRDGRGTVVALARIMLAGKHAGPESLSAAGVVLPVPETFLRSVRVGDTIRVKDSNKKKRRLTVIEKADHSCVCTCGQGAYILSRAECSLMRGGKEIAIGHVGDLPLVEEPIRLHPGDSLVLTKEGAPLPAHYRDKPHVACTLPEAFATAVAGQSVFFDDGKIEGRIREVHVDHMLVEILHTGAGEAKLGSAKGINFPDTDLGVGAMTEKDRRDLDFVAEHADIVGLSFVRRPEDVLELQKELASRGKSDLGVVLKIETRQGFDMLPLIMIAALRHHPAGIMVARGDLAIEVGFVRLAEVQEEILWLSEAAHMPVIWATQVLETLAQTGVPSRAEVTDAAMGVRAECVMLNKGEHIIDAVLFLDDILHRMQKHHMKKRSMLRRLAVAQVNRPGSAAS
jgi:pyruvate kinase